MRSYSSRLDGRPAKREGRINLSLLRRGGWSHLGNMFIVTEADATAIREIFHREGELSNSLPLGP